MAVSRSSYIHRSRRHYASDDEDQDCSTPIRSRSARQRYHAYAASDEDTPPAVYTHSACQLRYHDTDEGDAAPASYTRTKRQLRYYDSDNGDAAPAA
ncbi:hypothetical protein GJ744_001616 [Endocarpon pusillum]|uniref:Uncharacterized protein n=1 Tax=Endocarpon pusillum TaxID=364733 RepID=A0A8H7E121_9EURO|nr:hypothetical protein GJ744_001616 [Endocarpon pusillum]